MEANKGYSHGAGEELYAALPATSTANGIWHCAAGCCTACVENMWKKVRSTPVARATMFGCISKVGLSEESSHMEDEVSKPLALNVYIIDSPMYHAMFIPIDATSICLITNVICCQRF